MKRSGELITIGELVQMFEVNKRTVMRWIKWRGFPEPVCSVRPDTKEPYKKWLFGDIRAWAIAEGRWDVETDRPALKRVNYKPRSEPSRADAGKVNVTPRKAAQVVTKVGHKHACSCTPMHGGGTKKHYCVKCRDYWAHPIAVP